MPGQKFKTFCRISDYLEVADSELYELLRGTCAIMNLNTKRKPGLTMLIPKDKAFRKKITDLAYSSEIKDANAACDMLNALIIKDVFKSAADWMAKRANIPNSMFPSQHVEVKEVRGDKVVFANGAVASRDPDFISSARRDNISVWILESGEIPTNGKPAKVQEHHKRPVQGSAERSHNDLDQTRLQIALTVENTYMLDQINKRMGRDQVKIVGGHGSGYPRRSLSSCPRDAYLEYTMSFVLFLKNRHAELYERILPLVSFQKMDFYNIFEPYSIDNHLISSDIIKEWWTDRSDSFKSYNLQAMINVIGEDLSNGIGASAVLSKSRSSIISAIDAKRKDVYDAIKGRARSTYDVVMEIYKGIVAQNGISTAGLKIDNLFPAEYIAHYASNPLKLLAADEARYVVRIMFDKLERASLHGFDHGYFEKIISYVSTIQGAANEAELKSALQVVSECKFKYSLDLTVCVSELKTFVGSTFFMYIPLSPDEANNYPIKNIITRPNINQTAVWNLHQEGLGEAHLAIRDNNEINNDVINMLRTVDGKDAAVVNEIRQTLARLSK